MKRTILSLLLLFGLSMVNVQCSMAQAQNDAMYIYRNDGEFNAFLKADIDSIVQSHYDADSIYHADWQMQVVYTADSIYRIPLAAIDSVGLVAPPTIVNANVFELTSAHDPYLSACDTLRFTLSLDTPAEMCPSNGNVVVSTYDCLSFPDGIMARVLYTIKDKKGIHYTCKKVGLESVYDQLIFVGEGYIESPEASSRRKAEVIYERELWNREWSETLEKSGTTTTLDVSDAARMIVTVNIQRATMQYFSLELTNALTSSIRFNATSSFEKYYEKELAKVIFPRIRIPQCPLLFITPKLTLSGYFAEGAEVSLDFSAHFNRTDRVKFVRRDKAWSVNSSYVNDAGVDVASLSMTGYMEVGLIPDLFFSFCGSASGIGLEYSIGIKESVDFKFDALAAFDENMYSALKDSYARTTLPQKIRAYAQVGLWGDTGRQPFSYSRSFEPQLGSDKYLLPLFTKPEYEQGANAKTAVLKTEPSRDLLLPVQLGMSFYEGETKLETKYLSTTYRNQDEWPPNGLQVAYDKVEAGKTYTAYPTVKIMGKELRAEPSAGFPKGALSCPDSHHPHAIDLGLPSGTKWCCCNVGASTPEGYGGYYAWGETKPKGIYSWSTYFDTDDNGSTFKKYNNNGGLTELLPEDDAATANWGSGWQMPSLAQIQELCYSNSTTTEWTQVNGVNGRKITSKSNGNSIFLPAAGYRSYRGGPVFMDAGTDGYYWSCSLRPRMLYTSSDDGWAYSLALSLYTGGIFLYTLDRDSGRSVRPVCVQN